MMPHFSTPQESDRLGHEAYIAAEVERAKDAGRKRAARARAKLGRGAGQRRRNIEAPTAREHE